MTEMPPDEGAADANDHSDQILLTIRNEHVDPAPDIGALVNDQTYVAYYENDLGEQWIFIRQRDADRGTLFGGDVGWQAYEVYDRTPDQLTEELLRSGVSREMLDQMRGLLDPDPLVPSLVLSAGERTWLNNAWNTSTRPFGPEREHALVALGERLAVHNFMPEVKNHPNSKSYRAAMQTFTFLVGREVGRRGLDDGDAQTLLMAALKAL